MGTAYSVDVCGQNILVNVLPEKPYCAPTICLSGVFGTLRLTGDNEHLAEIEYALRTYLDSIRYPETPDQQLVLEHEINQSIELKEEIA